jgi:hypothetical protein
LAVGAAYCVLRIAVPGSVAVENVKRETCGSAGIALHRVCGHGTEVRGEVQVFDVPTG